MAIMDHLSICSMWNVFATREQNYSQHNYLNYLTRYDQNICLEFILPVMSGQKFGYQYEDGAVAVATNYIQIRFTAFWLQWIQKKLK